MDVSSRSKRVYRLNSQQKTLPPIHPNRGIQAAYARKLTALIEEMHHSVTFFVQQQYRQSPPIVAMDFSPAVAMRIAMNKLTARWMRKFSEFAVKLGEWFASSTLRHTDNSMKAALKDAGMQVEFRLSKPVHDAFRATLSEQVNLIKSIPQQYLTQVRGEVYRSVMAGRDIGTLAESLERHYGVTRKRAQFISKSQNNIATATITKLRQLEVGVERAIWLHSSGGRVPRKSHVAFSGQEYSVKHGVKLADDPEIVWPGTAPNCRCISKAILPGLRSE